jgi:uncharacterized protein (DUF433 family)
LAVTTATIDISELLEVEPSRGRVVVRGTKIGVQRIIGLHLEGRSADEISTAFKGLSLGAVYAALAYYYEHQVELDEEDAAEQAASEAAARVLGTEIL